MVLILVYNFVRIKLERDRRLVAQEKMKDGSHGSVNFIRTLIGKQLFHPCSF